MSCAANTAPHWQSYTSLRVCTPLVQKNTFTSLSKLKITPLKISVALPQVEVPIPPSPLAGTPHVLENIWGTVNKFYPHHLSDLLGGRQRRLPPPPNSLSGISQLAETKGINKKRKDPPSSRKVGSPPKKQRSDPSSKGTSDGSRRNAGKKQKSSDESSRGNGSPKEKQRVDHPTSESLPLLSVRAISAMVVKCKHCDKWLKVDPPAETTPAAGKTTP